LARTILFLSDYGLDDEYVGVCHSVITRIAPEVRVIDLTHGIPPRDIRRGALVLADAVAYAPTTAVYLAVVDPGVGTSRLRVAVVAGDAFLVGPDNGVLSLAWDALGGATRAFGIESDQVTLTPISATFHGRDVFAPAAAHLATGLAPESLGRVLDPARLAHVASPRATVRPHRIGSDVIGIDRFGNVQLSARQDDLHRAQLDSVIDLEVRVADRVFSLSKVRTFGEAPEGQAGLIVDSAGRLAVVVNGGNAAESLELGVGDWVEVGERAPGTAPKD
jgi:S-adenosyl-L-methionine hydrolase (adenosine-forming)